MISKCCKKEAQWESEEHPDKGGKRECSLCHARNEKIREEWEKENQSTGW